MTIEKLADRKETKDSFSKRNIAVGNGGRWRPYSFCKNSALVSCYCYNKLLYT